MEIVVAATKNDGDKKAQGVNEHIIYRIEPDPRIALAIKIDFGR